VAETLPGFLAGGWNVLLAPVGTPDAIIQKASADLRKAMDDADIKKKLAALGAYVHPMTPAEVTAFAQDQQKTWRPIAEQVAKEMTQAK
jgi:tripartite-type tricarboxylate transporter receptor subunit TctC